MDRPLQESHLPYLPPNRHYRRWDLADDLPRPQSPPNAKLQEARVRWKEDEYLATQHPRQEAVASPPRDISAMYDGSDESSDNHSESMVLPLDREVDIAPLLRKLVETNNALYDALLRGAPRHYRPTILRDIDEESWHSSIRESNSNTPSPPPPPAGPSHIPSNPQLLSQEIKGILGANDSAGVENKILSERAALDGQPLTAQPTVSETQWLVPYGTFLTGVAYSRYLQHHQGRPSPLLN
jgi:hypothetical protein